jgi:NAD dependent epimerase/dehydratase family enzyme
MYPDRGADWIDVATSLAPLRILESSLKAEAEIDRFTSAGNRGIVLRMGAFYGPTASHTRAMLQSARHGFALIFGRSTAYLPLIWIDDAALAVVDALTRAPAGTYNIVDDEPLQRRELVSVLAETVGRKWLLRSPSFLSRVFLGRHLMFLTRSQRVSNRRFKDVTAWTPMVPSARVGFRLLAIPP